MIIDLTSMMFNVNIDGGGGTPSWGTALGQGQDHRLNYTFGEDFYAGLIYSAVSNINDVTCPLGKGGTIVKGGEPSEKFSIDLACLFNKIYVNNEIIKGASFMLLVTKEYDSMHSGRKSLKYNPKITYRSTFINDDCINRIKNELGLNDKSAWLIYEINIINQNELHFSVLVVNRDNEIMYNNSSERKSDIENKIKVIKEIKSSSVSIEEKFKDYLKNIKNKEDTNITNIISSFKNFDVIELINNGMGWRIKNVFDILDKKSVCDLKNYIDKYEKENKERVYSGFLKSGLPYYIEFINACISYRKKDPNNKIFYGVPGVGKSYKIKQASDIFIQEKTVFHPEYTNADFVGQLLPIRKENNDSANNSISYEFVPGPFTRILAKALKDQNDSDNKYMLVIDEINRGNAAAIFGEIFQLLDRDESGQSEFGISNKEVYDYLVKEAGVDKSFLPDEKIYIPSNLYIWATMNTSDQNVYTLDTAFQRRWQMELLTIDFDKDDETKAQGDIKIQKSKNELKWREFVTAINEEISNRNEGMISVEDKRIGPWFAKRNEIEDICLFTQKVIKYLWDDAFKMSRPDVFKNIKTLDEIVNKIEQGCYIEDIFEENMFLKVLNNRKDNQKEEKEDNDNQVNENEE